MHVITPINIDNAYLSLSSATEPNPTWVSGQTYADEFLVNYELGSNHSLYRRFGAGGGTLTPDVDTANWGYVSPNNKWAMFDTSNSTKTTAMGNLAVVFQGLSGALGLGLFGLVGTSVTISVQTSLGAVTSQVVKAITGTTTNPDQVVIPSLTVPTLGTVNILVSHSGGASYQVACGTCAIGPVTFLGVTQPNPTLGIVSYSRKTTDDYGTTTFVKRANSKRLTAKLRVANAELDTIYRKLAMLDGVPGVWVLSDQAVLKPLDVFGFFKDFSIDVAYASESLCSLEIEGLA